MKCQSISNKNKLVSHQQNTVIRLSYQFYSCFYFVIAFLSATFILHHKKTCTCFVIANRDRRLANGYKTNSLIKLNKLSFFVPVAACFFCSLSPLEDCIQIGEIFLSSVCLLFFVLFSSSLLICLCAKIFFCEYVFVCLFVLVVYIRIMSTNFFLCSFCLTQCHRQQRKLKCTVHMTSKVIDYCVGNV